MTVGSMPVYSFNLKGLPVLRDDTDDLLTVVPATMLATGGEVVPLDLLPGIAENGHEVPVPGIHSRSAKTQSSL